MKYFDGYDNQPITWIDDPVSVRDVQSAQVFNNAAGFNRPCQIEIKHSLVTCPLDRWQSPLDGSAWKPCIAISKTPFFHQDHPSQPSQAPQEPPPGHQHCGQEIPWNQVNIDVVLACMLPVDHAEFDLMQW